jgi:DNA-binding MarR family transcriptional regulator
MRERAQSQTFTKAAALAGQRCVCFNVRKAARAVTQLYDEMLRPTGLRVTQFSLLMATSGLDSVTLKRLARAVGMDRTTLTRNLRPLEKQGLLRIETGADRRERKVTLTARGERTMAAALPLWEAVQDRVTISFGHERLRRLFTELAALAAAGRAA